MDCKINTSKKEKSFSHSEGYTRIKDENGNWVLEHRVIMEKALGRKLEDHEHVHHKNSTKRDNRKSNLKILNNSEHGKLTQLTSGKQTEYIQLICPACQKEFNKKLRYYKFGIKENPERQFFCSRRCSGIYNRKKQLENRGQ